MHHASTAPERSRTGKSGSTAHAGRTRNHQHGGEPFVRVTRARRQRHDVVITDQLARKPATTRGARNRSDSRSPLPNRERTSKPMPATTT